MSKYVYDVTAPGFMFGTMYAPNTDRNQIVTETELKPCPSWLKLSSKTAGKNATRIAARQQAKAEEKKKQIEAQNNEIKSTSGLVKNTPDFVGGTKKDSNIVTL